MKFFAGTTIIAAAILTSPPAFIAAWDRHSLNARAEEAGRFLAREYERTPSEQLLIVSAYARRGDTCVEFTDQGADPASVVYGWAIAHSDGTVEYNLDQDEFAERCEGGAADQNV